MWSKHVVALPIIDLEVDNPQRVCTLVHGLVGLWTCGVTHHTSVVNMEVHGSSSGGEAMELEVNCGLVE